MHHHAALNYSIAHAYVDTLGIISERILTSRELGILNKTCRSIQRIFAKSLRFPRKGFKYLFQLPTRLTRNMLEFLLQDTRFAINELHIAMDFICKTKQHAEWFSRKLKTTLLKPYKRSPGVQTINGTRYAERRKWGRNNQVMYEEERDRHTARPCVHLEIRITGEKQVGKNIRLTNKQFWRKHLKFRRIDYAAIANSRRDGRRKTQAAKAARWRGVRMAAEMSWKAGEDGISVQAVSEQQGRMRKSRNGKRKRKGGDWVKCFGKYNRGFSTAGQRDSEMGLHLPC